MTDLAAIHGGVLLGQPGPAKRPDMHAWGGRAWVCSHPDQDTDSPLSVAEWLVNVPLESTPVRFWTLGVIAAAYDGQDYGIRLAPQMTHEFRVQEISPWHPLPDIDRWGGEALHLMAGWKHQVALVDGGAGNREAQEICEAVAQSIIARGVNPCHPAVLDAIDNAVEAAGRSRGT